MTGLDADQLYLFDTFGYLVLADVISTGQIEELRCTLQHAIGQFEPTPQAQGPLHWAKVWRDLLDLPKLSPVPRGHHRKPRLEAKSRKTWTFSTYVPY